MKLKNDMTENIIYDADKSCKQTEAVINKYSREFAEGLQENDNHLQTLSKYLGSLELQIPDLNQQVGFAKENGFLPGPFA